MRGRWTIWAASLTGLLSLSACRDVLGVDPRSEGPAPLDLGESCSACVAARCDGAERACAADPQCALAAACMVDVGFDNPIGRATCREQQPKGAATAELAVLDVCMRDDCQNDCYGGTGFFASYSPQCQACTEASCGDLPSRCVADSECEALAVDAFQEGPTGHDPATLTPLTAAIGDAGETRREMGYCPISNCPLECGFEGTNMECLESYQWPRSLPSTAQIELSLYVANTDLTESPFPFAEVDVCRSAGDDCVPTSHGIANADGLATVTVELDSNSGFRGFFRVRPDTVDGQETLATHVFAYPLTRDIRGLAPAFRVSDVETFGNVLAGGVVPGRGQVAVQFFDCSARQAGNIELSAPAGALEGATLVASSLPGFSVIYNAKPGCYELVGHDESARETHRMKVQVVPDVVTWAYILPTSDPPALGYTCTADFE